MHASTLLFGELHFSMTFSPKPDLNLKHIIIIARIANLAEFKSSRQSLKFTWYFKKAADRGKITNKRRPRINVAPYQKNEASIRGSMRKNSVQLGYLHHPDNYDSISAQQNKRDFGTFQVHNI